MHVVVPRLIGTRREPIATLNACGSRSREIGRHDWQRAIGIGLWGGMLGDATASCESHATLSHRRWIARRGLNALAGCAVCRPRHQPADIRSHDDLIAINRQGLTRQHAYKRQVLSVHKIRIIDNHTTQRSWYDRELCDRWPPWLGRREQTPHGIRPTHAHSPASLIHRLGRGGGPLIPPPCFGI
jgi:hypothetical protein